MKIWARAKYEKLFMEKPKKIIDYQLIIADAQMKIVELRDKCKHYNRAERTHIRLVPKGQEHTKRLVCNDCDKVLD